MRIYLLGFMGSGKSFTAKHLAEQLAMDFIDLDDLIEERAEKSIPKIFAEDGEEAFRALEMACLRSLGEMENLVVACGGGTPCFFDNMDWMNNNGFTLFLDTSVALLRDRLKSGLAHRPLLAGKSEMELQLFIEEKLAERMLFYKQAILIYRQETGEEKLVEELAGYLLPMIKS